MALGIIASPEDSSLGIELSGIVRRAGSRVTNVSVGDRIFAVGAGGFFASTVIIPSSLVVKITDNLSFEDAATMPACFGTVLRSLMEVAQLEKNQVSVFPNPPSAPEV